MKIHYHEEQFDEHLHAWCGKRGPVVVSDEFEATDPSKRCKVCEKDWFPRGQPDWHLKQAKERTK